MRKVIFLMFTITIALPLHAQMNLKNLDIGFNRQQQAKKEYVREKELLKIYLIKAKPTLAQEVKIKNDFIPLDQALKQDLIIISETSQGGSVNELIFHNVSKHHIMLQMGDVITGGKQDRVIKTDYILQPGEKAVIDVYCVEKGRWSSSQQGVAQFNEYHSRISNDVRRTISTDGNQQAVWNQVDAIHESNDSQNSSSTYAAVTSNSRNLSHINSYVDFFYSQFRNMTDIVGLVAVSGNKVIGADIFASNKLLQNNLRNLLQSYATEAVLHGSEVSLSESSVHAWIHNLLENEDKQKEIINRSGSAVQVEGKNLKISAF
ncbi:MAG: hypothetical protein Q4F57_04580 [Weeksellaceae bacterium]|nr:hypothetical protein [Weeksellaceae bacterium]